MEFARKCENSIIYTALRNHRILIFLKYNILNTKIQLFDGITNRIYNDYVKTISSDMFRNLHQADLRIQ